MSSNLRLLMMSTLLAFSLASCGGEGGGAPSGGYSPDISYSGINTPAELGLDNAKTLTAFLFDGGGDPLELPAAISQATRPNEKNLLTDLPLRLLKHGQHMYGRQSPTTTLAGIVINEQEDCSGGGRVSYSGDLDNQGRGTLEFRYYNCVEAGIKYNGNETLEILELHNSGIPVHYISTMSTMSIEDHGLFVTLSGSVEVVTTSQPNKTTENLIVKDHLQDQTFKYENLVTEIASNSANGPHYDLAIHGRIYNPDYGYFDISTPVVLSYASSSQFYPDAGGIQLDDATGNQLTINIHSQTEVALELDLASPVNKNYYARLPWLQLNSAPSFNLNQGPVTDLVGPHIGIIGDSFYLDGLGTYDADYDFLEYDWELIASPTGSSATLQKTAPPSAKLISDLAGIYRVRLTTSDREYSHAIELQFEVKDGSPKNQLQSWATFQGNAARTGYVPLSLDSSDFVQRWEMDVFGAGGTVYNEKPGFVTGDHLVYVLRRANVDGEYRSFLTVLDSEDGQLVWEYEFTGSIIGIPFSNPPAYYQGHVYVQTISDGNRYLWALDISNKSLKYKVPYDTTGPNQSPAITDAIYTRGGISGAVLSRINTDTGATEWIKDPGITSSRYRSTYQSTPAVNDVYVITFSRDGMLRVRYRDTGEIAYTIADGNPDPRDSQSSSTPVIGSDSNVIVRTRGGALTNFDLTTRSIQWEVIQTFSTYRGFAQPVLANGIVYTYRFEKFQAYKESDGTLLWEIPLTREPRGNIVVTDTHAFVADSYLNLYAIDLNTRQANTIFSNVHDDDTPRLALGEAGTLYLLTYSRLFAISLEGDNDGDGMTAWWERRYGLDDNNASDQNSDQDGDGLNALGEYLSKTNPLDGDSDKDGLLDGIEVLTHGSDPLVVDTDLDGINDYEEVTTHGTSPISEDTDNDSLSDADEIYVHGTDPTKDDSDLDGQPDDWEIANNLDPLSDDAGNDPDSDTLTNVAEFGIGTDPHHADTDSDGLHDGLENNSLYTNPLRKDSDGDLMHDGWEFVHSFNPLVNEGADLDPDNDQFTNLAEAYGDSDPSDPTSVPVINSWTMFQGSEKHNAYVPIIIETSDMTERWRISIGTDTDTRPVVEGGGEIYLASNDIDQARLYALNADTGAQEWQIPLGAGITATMPAYESGTVYVQTLATSSNSTTSLQAFDVATRQMKFNSAYVSEFGWQFGFLKSKAAAPTVFEDKVYIAGYKDPSKGYAYAYNGEDGSLAWSTGLLPTDLFTPTVDTNDLYVYGGRDDNLVEVYNRITGQHKYTITHPNLIWISSLSPRAPIAGNQDDLLLPHAGYIYRFDLPTRSLIYESYTDFDYLSQPVIALGKMYSRGDYGVKRNDQITGMTEWYWGPPFTSLAGNIIVTPQYFFVSTDTDTLAVDLETQTIVWSYPLGGELALSDQGLYISSANGEVAAINIRP